MCLSLLSTKTKHLLNGSFIVFAEVEDKLKFLRKKNRHENKVSALSPTVPIFLWVVSNMSIILNWILSFYHYNTDK